MIEEVLLPRTDAGVAAQFGVVVVATVVLSWIARRERSVVTLILGVAMVLLGLMALRAMH
jgi:hypothetical protein